MNNSLFEPVSMDSFDLSQFIIHLKNEKDSEYDISSICEEQNNSKSKVTNLSQKIKQTNNSYKREESTNSSTNDNKIFIEKSNSKTTSKEIPFLNYQNPQINYFMSYQNIPYYGLYPAQ